MIKDFLHIVIKNLRSRKLRSWLTIIGIIISVTSIVALISISNGLQNAIETQFSKIGANRIFVGPQGDFSGSIVTLTTKDVETLESMSEFEFVTPYLFIQSAKIEFSNEEQYTSITGWPTEDAKERMESYDINFLEGRAFEKGQKRVAIAGYLVATDLFEKDVSIRNNIYINDEKFEIIGIMDEIGNEQDDRQIYIPIDDAREIFNKPDEVSYIDATVKRGRDLTEVVAKTERTLERKRGNENFQIITPEQVLEFLRAALGIVRGILVSIASISLIVGCVGILNSMYTSVLERTKEIGVMKSIGATNNNIMLLFLMESGTMGLIGGLLGLIFGTIISYGVQAIAFASGFKLLTITIDPILMISGLVFAIVIGMLSGALPARQAAKLHPVDALRWQ